MEKPLTISVIITVKNERNHIAEVLTSLNEQRLLPAEVVICDANSTDGTWEWLIDHMDGYHFPLKLLQKKGNRSVGRNAAISQATSERIAITDAGCTASATWLYELAVTFKKLGKTGTDLVVIAGHTWGAPQSYFEEAVVPYVLVMDDKIDDNTYLPATRSMLITKSAWEKAGRFDESLDDAEDYAFARRLSVCREMVRAFTGSALVFWRPRTTLWSFGLMIYHYAYGDAVSKSFRPKVFTIYARYGLGLLLLLATFIYESAALAAVLLVCGILYVGWSIQKNKRYVPHGWYWLPVLQIVSDLAVMWGTLRGYARFR